MRFMELLSLSDITLIPSVSGSRTVKIKQTSKGLNKTSFVFVHYLMISRLTLNVSSRIHQSNNITLKLITNLKLMTRDQVAPEKSVLNEEVTNPNNNIRNLKSSTKQSKVVVLLLKNLNSSDLYFLL